MDFSFARNLARNNGDCAELNVRIKSFRNYTVWNYSRQLMRDVNWNERQEFCLEHRIEMDRRSKWMTTFFLSRFFTGRNMFWGWYSRELSSGRFIVDEPAARYARQRRLKYPDLLLVYQLDPSACLTVTVDYRKSLQYVSHVATARGTIILGWQSNPG